MCFRKGIKCFNLRHLLQKITDGEQLDHWGEKYQVDGRVSRRKEQKEEDVNTYILTHTHS